MRQAILKESIFKVLYPTLPPSSSSQKKKCISIKECAIFLVGANTQVYMLPICLALRKKANEDQIVKVPKLNK